MKKAVKISLVSLVVVVLILFLLILTPFVFKDKFAAIVKSTASKSLRTELNFSGLDVSFFHHFPHLTITLNDFSLKSCAPFTKDTLVAAKDISFGVNLLSIFSNPIKITRVYLNRARIKVLYNEQGANSFDVFVPGDTIEKKNPAATESADLKIEDITIRQSDFIYSDASIPVLVFAHGINYKGKSDLTKSILKLRSRVQIDSLDFIYNSVAYLKSKPVNGDLTTSINTSTSEMKFEKNDLKILDIPFNFKGQFLLRPDGYDFYISLLSIYEGERLNALFRVIGTNKLWITSRINADINLGKWAKGLGITSVDLKGKLKMNLEAEGIYESGQNPKSNKPDTVILSIPDFTLSSEFTEGYLKYEGYPKALTGISFNITAASNGNDYRKITFAIKKIRAQLMKNEIEGYFRLKGLQDFPVDAHIATNVNLAELHQALPLDSLDLSGDLSLNLDVKGNYAPDKKLFPVSSIDLKLKDGTIQTKYYPHPIGKINVVALITNSTGKLADTRVKLNPVSFDFEGNPLIITAELSDPDNLHYDITSRGSIDLGKVYKVFSRKGMDLDGFIGTDMKLKGIQSDALAGNYGKMNNSGRLELRDIEFSSEYLRQPFLIKTGIFRFDNDNIRFEKFKGKYIASDITLDGYLNNVINYLLSGQKLKGSFTLTSDYLLADEFMVNGEMTEASSGQKPAVSSQSAEAGVIMVPENLEIGLKANAKKVNFRKLDINNVTASVEVKQGMMLMKGMSFDLIGCKVNMEATYGAVNPAKAFFDFHIVANNFDVKRAYNEVEMFRTLLSSAANCEGIISLDYSLKGRLDKGMNPIYPSLEGGGTVTLKKVKVMGMKLFTAMSKNLEKDKIRNPDLSKVELKTTIKNNVITLEKTKMKISGFRFRIAGETNFNGALNFKARLGLPPLGIVGIPIRILGTQDNPKFKYGRGNNDEDVEETNYSDEIPKDLLDKIKNAKDEDLKDEPGK